MVDFRQARPMTARTLEEIEALAAEATPGPWTTKGKSVKALGAPSERTAPNGWQGGICNCMGSGHGPRSRIDALAETNAALIAELPNLLAIAQGQRVEIARLKGGGITSEGSCNGCRHQGGCGQDHWHSSQCQARK